MLFPTSNGHCPLPFSFAVNCVCNVSLTCEFSTSAETANFGCPCRQQPTCPSHVFCLCCGCASQEGTDDEPSIRYSLLVTGNKGPLSTTTTDEQSFSHSTPHRGPYRHVPYYSYGTSSVLVLLWLRLRAAYRVQFQAAVVPT